MTDQFAGREMARHEITRQEIAGHENARHENAGHEHDGPKMMVGRKIAGEKRTVLTDITFQWSVQSFKPGHNTVIHSAYVIIYFFKNLALSNDETVQCAGFILACAQVGELSFL